jgi:AraC-like DNA-binding protein
MPELTVAASYARALLEVAVSRGADRVELAQRAHIDLAALDDPDRRIRFQSYVALMRAGKQLANDPALALHFGEAFDAGEVSVGCLISGFAETIEQSFALMNRYSGLAIETEHDGDRFLFKRTPGETWFIDARKHANDFPELTETTFARIVCTSRRLLGGRALVKAVYVTHKEPPYRDEYERIFQVPVAFESECNALLNDDWWVDAKVFASSPATVRILSAHAEALLEKLESSKTTRGRVESVLLPMLHTGGANMSTVAAKLGTSRQTLFRRLRAEGVTFEQILDELRHSMALHYLREKRVSVNETALLVGFSEPAAFSRAFKRWTGSSPRTERRNAVARS